MTDYQWNGFWDNLRNTGKWKDKWNPSERDEQDWRQELEGYDPTFLDKARRELNKKHGRYLQPDLGKFLSILRIMVGVANEPMRATVPIFYICCAKDNESFGNLGQITRYDCPTNCIPNDDQVRQHSDYLHQFYGGHWLFMQGDQRQARKRSYEIKHEDHVCQGWCPFCNPEQAAQIEQVTCMADIRRLFGGEPLKLKKIESPRVATEQEKLRQEQEVAQDYADSHRQEFEQKPQSLKQDLGEFDPNRLYKESNNDLPF